MYQDIEILVKAGIPRHLFKILASNSDIELKPLMETTHPSLL
jgi:hypothetical protein